VIYDPSNGVILQQKCNFTPLGGSRGSYYNLVIIRVMHVQNPDICVANGHIMLILQYDTLDLPRGVKLHFRSHIINRHAICNRMMGQQPSFD